MAKHAISQRRACQLASVDPKTVRRERVPDYPEIRQRLSRSGRAFAAPPALHGKTRLDDFEPFEFRVAECGGLRSPAC
jgi:hypothetical protein